MQIFLMWPIFRGFPEDFQKKGNEKAVYLWKEDEEESESPHHG